MTSYLPHPLFRVRAKAARKQFVVVLKPGLDSPWICHSRGPIDLHRQHAVRPGVYLDIAIRVEPRTDVAHFCRSHAQEAPHQHRGECLAHGPRGRGSSFGQRMWLRACERRHHSRLAVSCGAGAYALAGPSPPPRFACGRAALLAIACRGGGRDDLPGYVCPGSHRLPGVWCSQSCNAALCGALLLSRRAVGVTTPRPLSGPKLAVAAVCGTAADEPCCMRRPLRRTLVSLRQTNVRRHHAPKKKIQISGYFYLQLLLKTCYRLSQSSRSGGGRGGQHFCVVSLALRAAGVRPGGRAAGPLCTLGASPPPRATGLRASGNRNMTTPAKRRLMRDFKRLQTDPPAGISGAPSVDNIMQW
jgi:hypothetical protein